MFKAKRWVACIFGKKARGRDNKSHFIFSQFDVFFISIMVRGCESRVHVKVVPRSAKPNGLNNVFVAEHRMSSDPMDTPQQEFIALTYSHV